MTKLNNLKLSHDIFHESFAHLIKEGKGSCYSEVTKGLSCNKDRVRYQCKISVHPSSVGIIPNKVNLIWTQIRAHNLEP